MAEIDKIYGELFVGSEGIYLVIESSPYSDDISVVGFTSYEEAHDYILDSACKSYLICIRPNKVKVEPWT